LFFFTHVAFDKTKTGPLPDLGKIGGAAGLQVVIHRNRRALPDQPLRQVAADKTGTAENQYFFVLQVHQIDSRFVGLTFQAGQETGKCRSAAKSLVKTV
jgi:hypothetical protein